MRNVIFERPLPPMCIFAVKFTRKTFKAEKVYFLNDQLYFFNTKKCLIAFRRLRFDLTVSRTVLKNVSVRVMYIVLIETNVLKTY